MKLVNKARKNIPGNTINIIIVVSKINETNLNKWIWLIWINQLGWK